MSITTRKPGQKRSKPVKPVDLPIEVEAITPAKHPLADVIGSMSSPTWLEIVEEQEQERLRQRQLREQDEREEAAKALNGER